MQRDECRVPRRDHAHECGARDDVRVEHAHVCGGRAPRRLRVRGRRAAARVRARLEGAPPRGPYSCSRLHVRLALTEVLSNSRSQSRSRSRWRTSGFYSRSRSRRSPGGGYAAATAGARCAVTVAAGASGSGWSPPGAGDGAVALAHDLGVHGGPVRGVEPRRAVHGLHVRRHAQAPRLKVRPEWRSARGQAHAVRRTHCQFAGEPKTTPSKSSGNI
jgi:hypothetical protein